VRATRLPPQTVGVTVARKPFIAMRAMNGSRKGLTMKRRFDTEEEALAEAAKLNADRDDPAELLDAYPCRYDDDCTWGESTHWHMGRNRALRKAGA
jgi:hypothetical protein